MKNNTLTNNILGCYTAENKICTFEHMFSLCNCSEATLRRRISHNDKSFLQPIHPSIHNSPITELLKS